MKLNSRMIGLLLFVALVAMIQVAEGWYRWYVHRDDRVHLSELREELIDAGAEMIEAQLEIGRIREAIENVDSDTGGHLAARTHPRRTADGAVPGSVRAAAAAGQDVVAVQIWDRNRHIDELNTAVARRNSAAAQYTVLADSIRRVATRVRDPYFAVPLPAEAATRRGITPDVPRPPAAGEAPTAEARASESR